MNVRCDREDAGARGYGLNKEAQGKPILKGLGVAWDSHSTENPGRMNHQCVPTSKAARDPDWCLLTSVATKESLLGQFQPVCHLDELSDGQGRSFVVNDQVIGLFRIGNEVYALDDRCPHAGASLARGYVEGDVVRCRIHHWGFRLCDGTYVDEDRPSCNARSIPVRVVGSTVEVLLSE